MFPPSDLKPFIPAPRKRAKRRKGRVIISESERQNLFVFRQKLFTEQGGICYYCKLPTPVGEWTIEHKQPISRGGKHIPENCVGACADCNNEKGNLTEAEYLDAIRTRGHVSIEEKAKASGQITKRRRPAFVPRKPNYSQRPVTPVLKKPPTWCGREIRLRICKLHTTIAWQEHHRKKLGRLLTHNELKELYRPFIPMHIRKGHTPNGATGHDSQSTT